jgi:hypothetical protein
VSWKIINEIVKEENNSNLNKTLIGKWEEKKMETYKEMSL